MPRVLTVIRATVAVTVFFSLALGIANLVKVESASPFPDAQLLFPGRHVTSDESTDTNPSIRNHSSQKTQSSKGFTYEAAENYRKRNTYHEAENALSERNATTTVVLGSKAYSSEALDELVKNLSTTFLPWKASTPQYGWCHDRHNIRNDGLLYVKLYKCASSTAAGVTIRIADKLGQRLGRNCTTRHRHAPAWHKVRQYGKRPLSTSVLWTLIRQPHKRLVSHYFFEHVSRANQTASHASLYEFVKDKKSYMLQYLQLTNPSDQYNRQAESIIRDILSHYTFIGLSDRMTESLVVLALLLQIPLADVVLLSAKVTGLGNYDAGRSKLGCVKLVEPPPEYGREDFWGSDEWKNDNWDQVLFRVVNRSLDKTIDGLGRDLVQRHVESYKRLSQFAHDSCQDKAIFPCPRTLPNHVALATKDCYFADSGCGYRCLDQVLKDESDRQWDVIEKQTTPDERSKSIKSTTRIPEWLQNYVEFQKASLHSDGRIKQGVPYLVYHCYGDCAGLGGRLKGIIKSLFAAVCAHRVFVIDSPFPFPLEHYFAPNMIQWNLSYPRNSTLLTAVFDKGIHIPESEFGIKIAKAHGKEMREMGEIWDSKICRQYVSAHNVTLDDYDEQELYHLGSQVLFRFTEPVQHRARDIRQEAGLMPKSKYVGIHLRTGAGDSWKERSQRLRKFKLGSHTPFLKCFRQLSKLHHYHVSYLASDNNGRKMALAARLPQHLKIANVTTFHVDRSLSTNTSNGHQAFLEYGQGYGANREGRASVETASQGMLDLFAELSILVEADCLILSESSFSYAAYVLSRQPACGVLVQECNDETVKQVGNLRYGTAKGRWFRISKQPV